jgi:serine/threonine protein kinase
MVTRSNSENNPSVGSNQDKTIHYPLAPSQSQKGGTEDNEKTHVFGRSTSTDSTSASLQELALERNDSRQKSLRKSSGKIAEEKGPGSPKSPKKGAAYTAKAQSAELARASTLSQKSIEEMIRKAKGAITEDIEKEISALGATITSLDLHGVHMNIDKMNTIIQKLPNLQELNLRSSDIDDETLAAVGKLTKLKNLDLSFSKNITDIGLRELEKLEGLSRLDLTGCTRIQGEVIDLLGVVKSLKSIKLNGCNLFLEGKWLQNFLRKRPSDAYVKCILDLYKEQIKESSKPLAEPLATIERVIKRYEYFEKIGLEKEPLQPYEILHLAHFIEARIPEMDKRTSYLFSKSKFDLPRAILFFPEQGKVHIRAKRQFSKLVAEGSSKDVVDAVEVPLKGMEQPKIVAWAVSKVKKAKGRLVSPKEIALSFKEALLCRDKLKGQPKIAQTFFVFEYRKKVIGLSGTRAISADQPRVCIISERFDGNLTRYLTGPVPALETILTLSRDTGIGLANLHALKLVQGDFKAENCLFRIDPQTHELEAAITDMGLAFDTEKETPSITYRTGFYGTIANTSPEQLGVENFSGDFSKTDVFAYGIMLYKLYFRENPPWLEDITKYFNEVKGKVHDPVKLEALRKVMQNKIQISVEKPLSELLKKSSMNAKELFECQIYQALREKPEDRASMRSLVESIAAIKPTPSSVISTASTSSSGTEIA